MPEDINKGWIALIKIVIVAAALSADREDALVATQTLITMLGSQDLAARELMAAHNELADGFPWKARSHYYKAIELLKTA